MAKKYVKAYYDWIEQTAALSDAERGRLFIAILEYARSGLEPKLDGRESILFPVFQSVVDRDNEKNAVLAENGAKGGKNSKANLSKSKQNEANLSKSKPTNNKRHNTQDIRHNTQDIEQKTQDGVLTRATRFTPPTVNEVAEYCGERGNGVDPERFVDFYASKGWKVGKEPMKDWKATVRTWERRDSSGDVFTSVLREEYARG